ncbi:MAG: 50S ribosomal protein L10 [Fibrobacter sp.]|nr:50S ribosomal protein L10 [Fibrobacter sp.]
MKTLDNKKQIVKDLVNDFKEASAIYLYDYTGINVAKDNALRNILNEQGVKYKAVKNTLLKRVFEELGISGLDENLVGATSVMIGETEDPMLPARLLVDFLKKNPEALATKAINFDGSIMPGSELAEIAKMPTREELLGQIVSMAMGPGANLVAILNGPGATIAGQLKALEEKLQQG